MGAPAPAGASPGDGPDAGAIGEAAREGEERRRARREWLGSDEAREERVRSRRRHRGIGAGESRALLLGTFGWLLDGLSGESAGLARDGRFIEFFDDYTARVRTEGGPKLLRSWLPLRVTDANGYKQPVDLTLREHAGGFGAVMPLVPATLPARLGEPIRFGSEGLAVRVEAAASSVAAGRSGPSTLFYANADTDTDVVLVPVTTGIEVLWQLRSEESPETFSLRFDLPEGAELRRSSTGAVDVVRGSDTLGSLRPPQVVDAQGEPVAASSAVQGDRVVFSIAHRGADVAYPLALDPVMEDHRAWYWGGASGMWDWGFGGNSGIKMAGYYSCWWGNPCFSQSGFGLHVLASDNNYSYGENGFFQYTAPGQTGYISRAEFSNMAFQWAGQCCANAASWDGLWDPSRGWVGYRDVNYQYWYRADTFTGAPGTRSASFGEVFLGSGRRTPVTVAYLGSVLMYLDDPEAPSVGLAGDNRPGAGTGGWMREGAISIATTSSDAGLGLRRSGLASSSSLPSDATQRTLVCWGSKALPCPGTLADSWSVPVTSLPEGVSAISAYAEDVLGKRTTRTLAPARVDRNAPTIALSGTLYDHRDRPLDEAESYGLRVRAQEASCTTDGQRSGVASIEIRVDGVPKGTYSQATVGRCLYEIDWTYRPADYSPGEHAVTVLVTDHTGNRRVRHLRPLYVAPSTSADAGETIDGLAAAAGLGDEDIEAIKSPRPELSPEWRGTVFPDKGYFGSGFTQPRVAVGGGRIYVAAGNAGVKSFDLREPSMTAPTTITTTPAPGGIAYYRDELYVARERHIDVYNPANLQAPPRQIGAAPCGTGTTCDSTGLGLKRPQGLDAAWGKLFVADDATDANADITRVYATDTGIPLGLSANGDPAPSFRDVSVAPDQNLYFDGKRASTWLVGAGIPWLNTGPLLDGYEPDTAPPTSAADADWCDCPTIRGTDWVWGMNWLLAATNNGTRIEEFGPSVRKRTWTPKQTNGTVNDIVYHKREERLEASGNLMRSDWINHDQQLVYIVSDADIYVLGSQGEHWYEQARTFAYLEVFVNDTKVPFSVDGVPSDVNRRSTDPAGTLTLNTHDIRSGPAHSLKVIATLEDGRELFAANTDLRIDHSGPVGSMSKLPYAVRGSVTLMGEIQDQHSGPLRWSPEASMNGAPAWSELCRVDQPGPFSCEWDTRNLADGSYALRARLLDVMTDQHENVAWSAEQTTIVDNTPPDLHLTGTLMDAGTFPLEHGQPESLEVSVSDPASGATELTILVDGVPRDGVETPCPSGGCSLQRSFTLFPEHYPDGVHRIEVHGRDGAGNQAVRGFDFDVEMPPPPDPESAEDGDEEMSSASAANAGALDTSLRLGVDPNAATTEEYLACTPADAPTNFQTYSLGPLFEALPVTAVTRQCDLPFPGEATRSNDVTYIYGTCDWVPALDDPSDPGGCFPPIAVQTMPACETNLASYSDGPGVPPEYEELLIRGVPAAAFEDGLRLELYAGGATIVVYGDDPAQVRRAADELQAEPSGEPPDAPRSGGLLASQQLPPPASGAMHGMLSCTEQLLLPEGTG